MLVQNYYELVDRCVEHRGGLLDLDQLKKAFVDYVFGVYQQEVLAEYDLDAFYEHLEQIGLKHCRKDFDWAVEQWYAFHHGWKDNTAGYHDCLFGLVKEVVATYQPACREELVSWMTYTLTDPSAFMSKWRCGGRYTVAMYFEYLHKLGIRTYRDIESLVDSWLVECPRAFDKHQQEYFRQPSRRGRPNNVELLALQKQLLEVKPVLTRREKERIRKIYYYYRKKLSTQDMVEKCRRYLASRCETG